MKNVKTLPEGQYMKVESVQSYFQTKVLKSTLASVIQLVCPSYEGEYGLYYNVQDLRSVIVPDLFRELECEVTTHVILSKIEYLKALGVEIIDHDDAGVSFRSDYDYGIEWDDFEIGESLATICQNADLYSCCGDIVDQDWMRCPTCKENV